MFRAGPLAQRCEAALQLLQLLVFCSDGIVVDVHGGGGGGGGGDGDDDDDDDDDGDVQALSSLYQMQKQDWQEASAIGHAIIITVMTIIFIIVILPLSGSFFSPPLLSFRLTLQNALGAPLMPCRCPGYTAPARACGSTWTAWK